jgi:hypothetical protein
MDGYLSNKPDNFVDDPEKLYRLRRREAHLAKKLDFVDSKSEDKGLKESPENSPLLGNLGKPVTLETLRLTKFSKHVFQGQGIHEPGT